MRPRPTRKGKSSEITRHLTKSKEIKRSPMKSHKSLAEIKGNLIKSIEKFEPKKESVKQNETHLNSTKLGRKEVKFELI